MGSLLLIIFSFQVKSTYKRLHGTTATRF